MRTPSILAFSALLALGATSLASAQSDPQSPAMPMNNPAMPGSTGSAPAAAPLANGAPLTPDGQQALTSATKTYFYALHELGPKKLQTFQGIVAPNYHLIFPNGTTWDTARVIAWATSNNLNSSGLTQNVNIVSSQGAGDTVVATVDAAGTVVQAGNTDLQEYRSGSSTHVMTWMRTGGKWQLVEDRITHSAQSPDSIHNN
jgi:hypothetical protein